MKLAAFLLHDMDGVLADWETFAATQLPAAKRMAPLELRDHAREILLAVARDLQTGQTGLEQAEKSKGRAPLDPGAPETAAQTHAVLRARSGFDINQLVAEYRALRASVLRRWIGAVGADRAAIEDVTRFNEAIDQAIAESVRHFDERVERARDLLLGMLGHDLRSPLNTIVVTAGHLARLDAGAEVSAAAARLIRSGASMHALLDDLADFNRTRFGLGIRVEPTDVDLARVLNDELEQLRGAYPQRHIDATIPGEVHGHWDGRRLQQVLRNLVGNAVRYGAERQPIAVSLQDQGSGVVIAVTNAGAALAAHELEELFEPLRRGPDVDGRQASDEGLGLGLFIVAEIARSHGGQVAVRSDDRTTTFSVSLPRR